MANNIHGWALTKKRTVLTKRKTMTNNKTIIAYRGFDKDLCYKEMQYEVGKEYFHDGELIPYVSGFHACFYPLRVFLCYPPGTSRYCEVEISGETIEKGNLIVGKHMKILRELTLDEFISIAVKRRRKKIKTGIQAVSTTNKDKSASYTVGIRSASTTTGDCSASVATGPHSASTATGPFSACASTGYCTASTSTGDRSTSTSTGYYSTSSTTGHGSISSVTGRFSASTSTGTCSISSSTGEWSASIVTGDGSSASVSGRDSVACALGGDCKAKASEGSWISIVERNKKGEILNMRCGKAGRDIEPDTFYKLVDGEFVKDDNG